MTGDVRKPRRRVCPICRSPLEIADLEFAPFCSERCRMADLGSWLAGGYRIPGPTAGEGLHDPAAADPGEASPRQGRPSGDEV